MNIQEKSSQILDEIRTCLEGVDPAQMEEAVMALKQAPRIFVAGSGRSGLEASGLAMRLMHLGKKTFRTGESTCPSIGPKDLLVAISGSGKTGSLIRYATVARDCQASVLAITTSPDSPLGRMADHVLRIPAKAAKSADTAGVSCQPLSNLFVQSLCLCCDLLVMDLMERMEVPEQSMKKNHTNLE